MEIGNAAEQFHFWGLHKSDLLCSVVFSWPGKSEFSLGDRWHIKDIHVTMKQNTEDERSVLLTCRSQAFKQLGSKDVLKVVGNEKEGGSERCQTFTICL